MYIKKKILLNEILLSSVFFTEESSKDRDGYQWLLCSNRQPHEQEKLMLTQIIAGTSLWDLSKTLHDVRKKWNIPSYCNCAMNDNDQDSRSSSNGICKVSVIIFSISLISFEHM